MIATDTVQGTARRFGFRPAFLAGAASPTADLYFGFACADWLARGRVRRHAPTVFQADETLVIFRHAAGLARLPRHRRLIYLIDDDIREGLRDPGLPALYRAKLLALDWPAARAFERHAETILTTSAPLARRLRSRHPGKRVAHLDPAWPVEATPGAPQAGTACRIALLMGSSHARDAAPLMPVLEQALARHADAELTLSANLPVPDALRRNPRVTVLPALGWTAYFDWLRRARFEIGLVPHLAAARFNAARSASKLGEYAMAGAAVLASDSWAEGAAAARDGRCVVTGSRPAEWSAALEAMIADRAGTTALAARNLHALGRLDLPARQRALWAELLGGD